MKKEIPGIRHKAQDTGSGFTLIELMVAIFIFSIITVAIVSVFVSTVTSYGKAKAIKTVKEDTEFAMASIAKDVRMGKIEKYYKIAPAGVETLYEGDYMGMPYKYLVVSRNRGGKVCYKIDEKILGISEGIPDDNLCPQAGYNNLVDLSSTQMSFNVNTSGFFACPSTFGTPSHCPSDSLLENRRGWVEINLDIIMASGKEMEADQINVQTTVSSRDYGWEEL
ncbi:MAG: ComB [Candidatus Moranbacteria bacterium GW2011_GWC1_45_18]|nr:MAG: ComB [Candidatus Moranbacteria bacterium GW2011_GWC2_40_12]KKT34225.1 MAG: ComB [Candidatus Moranbacteria bacterium GW2011_GWF2_44_10]KKU00565.1 MAG: ComB [Candidatus Moranbacteria bacterium GW2011_GWC1_45_18]OGI24413.1 MAG: hypothetical protein A2194_05040 [Candidatus Moranbacteria bacterium RIFOXYA1_FULL_44_8]OGI36200.1 MAG: hypothetical protein A2407_03905 [Candidatus Moranbacteria bacterium RIFOXYC1_FULL_44_8]OGI39076.1 MAG: hypothetical protein A2374_04800 [Candidatus Moranbacteri